jgi:hypothetical protein
MRRWRLVTPLALAVLAIAIMTSGVLASASAHTAKFHFWGQAVVLEDNSIVLPAHACDTGPLSSLDGTQLNTLAGDANFGCITTLFGLGGNHIGTGNNQLGVAMTMVSGQASVVSDNTKKEGHVISTAQVVGLSVFLCFARGANDDCDGDAFTNANGGTTPDGFGFTFLQNSLFSVKAEAECELVSNHAHAGGRALSPVFTDTTNDLQVAEGTGLALLTPNGQANQSYPITNIVTRGLVFAEQITLNEQTRFHDGGIAWIKDTGIHLIITDAFGTVILNLSVDTVFAAIHCGRHLPSDDAVGA